MHLRELMLLIDPPPGMGPRPTCGDRVPRLEFALPGIDALVATTNPSPEQTF
jgi:hypothetical protein